MIIYHSNMGSVRYEHGEIEPFPILVSYYGLSPKWERPWYASKVMLDSGAFSAYRQDTEVNIKKYIRFCKDRWAEFDVIISLDVIGDPIASWENYNRMVDAGVNVIPVFHLLYGVQGGEENNPEVLRRYAEMTDYIGIGGIARKSRAYRRHTADAVFREYPDPKKIGFHGFGVADPTMITEYPWRTVDATSVHMQARYGGILTTWGWVKVGLNVSPKERKRLARIGARRVWAELEALGIDVEKVRGRRDPDRHQGDVLKSPKGTIRRKSSDKDIAESNSESIKERCRASILRFDIIAKQAPTKWQSKRESLLS